MKKLKDVENFIKENDQKLNVYFIGSDKLKRR